MRKRKGSLYVDNRKALITALVFVHRVDQQFGGRGWEEGKQAIFPLNMFSAVPSLSVYMY